MTNATRLLAAAAAALLLTGMAGCGGGATSSSKPAGGSTTPVATATAGEEAPTGEGETTATLPSGQTAPTKATGKGPSTPKGPTAKPGTNKATTQVTKAPSTPTAKPGPKPTVGDGGFIDNTDVDVQSPKTIEAKKKLDFGKATVTLIYEWQVQNKRGVSVNRDRWLDRVADVEKKFNVKIVEKQGSTSSYISSIVTSILSGKPSGNIYSVSGSSPYNMIKAGVLADFNNAMTSTGIDMTAARYSQMAVRYNNVNDKQYSVGYGDPRVSMMVLFNKRIFKDLKLESPYDLVKSKQWTWSKMTEFAKKATVRGKDGAVTQYGIGISMATSVAQALAVSDGGSFSGFDKTGKPTIKLDSKETRAALEQLYQWCTVDKVATFNWGNQSWNAMEQEFPKGKIAMYFTGFAGLSAAATNMADDYGVVYLPMGPDAKDYVSYMESDYTYVVPTTYQNQTDKYLLLLDELYGPYDGVSRDTQFRDEWIRQFRDSEGYTMFKNLFQKLPKVNDPLGRFDITWGEPPLGAVIGKLCNGEITAGNLVETYQDTYQYILDDSFKKFNITGLK